MVTHIASVHKVNKTLWVLQWEVVKLVKHITVIHEENNCFKSEKCDAKFDYKHTLKTHVSAVHEGKKPFKCDKCDGTFNY